MEGNVKEVETVIVKFVKYSWIHETQRPRWLAQDRELQARDKKRRKTKDKIIKKMSFSDSSPIRTMEDFDLCFRILSSLIMVVEISHASRNRSFSNNSF